MKLGKASILPFFLDLVIDYSGVGKERVRKLSFGQLAT